MLFHAYDEKTRRLCTWLVSSQGIEAAVVQTLDHAAALTGLRSQALQTLDLTTRSMPVRKSEMDKAQFDQMMTELDSELESLHQPRRR